LFDLHYQAERAVNQGRRRREGIAGECLGNIGYMRQSLRHWSPDSAAPR
jgi:hypothetical protein